MIRNLLLFTPLIMMTIVAILAGIIIIGDARTPKRPVRRKHASKRSN